MHKALTFILLLSTWLLFSGFFDAFHVGLGVLSSLFVTAISGDLLFSERQTSARDRLRELSRLPGYLLWLLWQIVLANLHVLKLALAPSGQMRSLRGSSASRPTSIAPLRVSSSRRASPSRPGLSP